MHLFKNLGQYVLTSLIAYLCGFYAYEKILNIVWDQSLGNDIYSVLFCGALAFMLVATPIYLRLINWMETKCKKYRLFIFPLGCMCVFFIPTMFIFVLFGSFNPFTSEALLFHAFFLSSGCVFGIGSAILK
ncbi:hypothetical protein ACQKII_19465 [Lysinibacillus sp. NPDC048646]|uniref:hypothetical protein n=1 Tax=Lysinibacillus sp. NPDC048646 TaxID=3390574 RepID=UPI003D038C8D